MIAAAPGREPPRRPEHWLRFAVVVLLAAAVAGGILTSGPAQGAATGTVSPRSPFVQRNCPGTTAVYPPLGAPASGSYYYGVPIASTVSGGSLTVGTVVKTTGLTGTVCGLLRFPQLVAYVPAVTCDAAVPSSEGRGCVLFTGTTSIDGLVDLPTTVVPAVDPTASVTGTSTTITVDHTPASNGGLVLSITSYVTTKVVIAKLGVTCDIGPIAVTLTTEASGPLTGRPVVGPLTEATAKIVGATFAVPSAHASADCPAALVPATNALAGLPASAGRAQFTAPLTLGNSLQ